MQVAKGTLPLQSRKFCNDVCSPSAWFALQVKKPLEGPFLVVKCLQGNTYRIKQTSNFRKQFLRHRDQVRLFRSRQVRLRPSQNDSRIKSALEVPDSVHPVLRPPESRGRELCRADSQIRSSKITLFRISVCPSLALRRGISSRRPPQRYGEWQLNPAFDDDDNVVVSLVQ